MPRYSCGSPAMVDPWTAGRVARQELQAYALECEGVYGEARQRRAQILGLRGIVERMQEARGGRDVPAKHRAGWRIWDLCTNETYWRPHTLGNYELYVGLPDARELLVPDLRALVFVAEYVAAMPAATVTRGADRIAQYLGTPGKYDFVLADARERFALQYTPQYEVQHG